MKKRMILVMIGLLVIAVGVSTYFATRKTVPESVVDQLPLSKLHEHTAPDGTVVQHHHTYHEISAEKADKSPPDIPAAQQHPWDRIDLAAVRRDYQKYTVPEMIKMWEGAYRSMYGPFSGKPPGPVEVAAEKMYPRDEWLARMLDYGLPFVTSSDYRFALSSLRRKLLRLRSEWDSDKAKFLEGTRFSPDITWKEYEEIVIKTAVVYKHGYWRTKDANPDSFVGGWTANDGTFVPFLQNTVHVYFSPEDGVAQFSGVKLTHDQKETLKMFGVAPKGVNVVYVDKHNKPLSAGTPPPRLYELRMKKLAQAQVLLQQQIEGHAFLLEVDELLSSTGEEDRTTPAPRDRTTEHMHDHTHEVPPSSDTATGQHRRQPPDISKQPPPLPEISSDLHRSDAINQWFMNLELLHGGKLPKDLQALQEIITELEKIRQDAEKNLKPPPRPERPTPEGSPTPDGDQ